LSIVNYDIICLSETWLNYKVLDAELGFTNFNFYRADRNLNYGMSGGGGVLIAVNNKIICHLLNIPVSVGFEQIFLKLTISNIKIILGCIYLPPNATVEMYSNHCDVIVSLFYNFSDHYFIITGDLNLNNFDWSVDPASYIG